MTPDHEAPFRRAVVLVLDGVGIGAAPDAEAFGDAGANTLAHAAEAVGGLHLPTLESLGLGNASPARGLPHAREPRASYGRMRPLSPAKDTTCGHWEMMGCVVEEPFALFPGGFPEGLIESFRREAEVEGVLGNKPASGTEILKELGEAHERTGWPIVYTSADSVFQIAAHEERIPLERLYRWCAAARRLADRFRIGRVIARPFVGSAGKYARTYNRRDFSAAPPRETVLDRLGGAGVPVVGVGKVADIFAGRGVRDSVHTEGNRDGMAAAVGLLEDLETGLVFSNLVDTDMLFGHRRDPRGFARCLEEFDEDLAVLLERLRPGDLLFVTADHGCDPTYRKHTDHTREEVPLLFHDPARPRGRELGLRTTFADLGATVAQALGVAPIAGRSLLAEVL